MAKLRAGSDVSYSFGLMRIDLNLSKRPFTNHRLLWVGVLAVLMLSMISVFWIEVERNAALAKANEYDIQTNNRKEEFEARKRDDEKRREEEKKLVLSEHEASELATARRLIPLRSFSAEKALAELEDYVPQNTRLGFITVSGISSGPESFSAILEISAFGRSPDQLTDMMARLEKSGGLFLVGDANQGQANDAGEIPFTIKVTYQPGRGGAQ